MTRRVKRTCMACGAAQPPEYGIPDPCLGMLPGVANACCGHGYAGDCYVMLMRTQLEQLPPSASEHPGRGDIAHPANPVVTLRGEAARGVQIALGGEPSPFIHDQDHMHLPGGLMPGWKPCG